MGEGEGRRESDRNELREKESTREGKRASTHNTHANSLCSNCHRLNFWHISKKEWQLETWKIHLFCTRTCTHTHQTTVSIADINWHGVAFWLISQISAPAVKSSSQEQQYFPFSKDHHTIMILHCENKERWIDLYVCKYVHFQCMTRKEFKFNFFCIVPTHHCMVGKNAWGTYMKTTTIFGLPEVLR